MVVIKKRQPKKKPIKKKLAKKKVQGKTVKGGKTKRKTEKIVNVVERIASISFIGQTYSINIYGKSATGKTTLWSGFPGEILAIICSGGKRSGELRSLDTKANRNRIKQVVVRHSDEIRELIEYQEEERRFKTIVLDHATGLQDFVLRELMGITKIPEQGSWGMADREVWGQCTLQSKEILRGFLELDCYRVIVAQEREFESNDPHGGESLTYISSALTPSLAGWLAPACDYVVNTCILPKMVEKEFKRTRGRKAKKMVRVKGKVEYCLRVGPNDLFATKFRMPKGIELPELIVDPTYNKIEKLLKGG